MTLEVAVVAVAVLSLMVLVVLRAKRTRDQRLRLGAATGYFDREAGRYAHSSGRPGAGSLPPALAPSFTSVPKRMSRRGGAGAAVPVPRPVPSFEVPDAGRAGAVPDLAHAGSVPVPAFAGSVPVRSLPSLPSLPPPPPGRPAAPPTAWPASSALPTLEQPPPPPIREAPPA